MKLLIVADGILSEALTILLLQITTIGSKIIQSNHNDALETFLCEDPDYILICECWDTNATGKIIELSKISFEDISNSAGKNVLIRTAGFDKENDLIHPFKLKDVLELFNI